MLFVYLGCLNYVIPPISFRIYRQIWWFPRDVRFLLRELRRASTSHKQRWLVFYPWNTFGGCHSTWFRVGKSSLLVEQGGLCKLGRLTTLRDCPAWAAKPRTDDRFESWFFTDLSASARERNFFILVKGTLLTFKDFDCEPVFFCKVQGRLNGSLAKRLQILMSLFHIGLLGPSFLDGENPL